MSKIKFLVFFFILACNSTATDPIQELVSPVILIQKSDTLNIVRDAEDAEYILTVNDLVSYRVAFLKIGDTLKE